MRVRTCDLLAAGAQLGPCPRRDRCGFFCIMTAIIGTLLEERLKVAEGFEWFEGFWGL